MDPSHFIDTTAPPRPGETLDAARLDAYLRAAIPDLGGPLAVEQFPGGFSNLTYLLRVGERELVLRRPPFGANIRGGHDMGREYRVLRGLSPVYPKVPRPLAYCDDLAVMGAPFYVMERVRGLILRPGSPLVVAGALTPDVMRRVCLSLIDTLAELHALDYAAAGLSDLGKPDGYVQRQVAGWTRRYAAARTDDLHAMEAIARWLAANVPPSPPATLIHNDYRYDNVILDSTDLSHIKAILDWEMATLGDPLSDVGTTLAYWAEAGDPPALRQFGLTTLPGNLDRQGFVGHYAARSGRDVSAILFHYVYGLFKNAVIIQQIYARYRAGHTQDERFAGLGALVVAYAQLASRAVETGRISGLGAEGG